MTASSAAERPLADRRLAWNLCAIFAAHGALLGVYLPFFPIWLAGKGFDETQIAIIVAAPILGRIASMPFLAMLADRYMHPARVLLGLNLIVAAGYAWVLALDATTGLIIVLLVVTLSQAPGLVFGDVLTTAAAARLRWLNYGHVRMWASIAFLAANLISGIAVGWYGASIVGVALLLGGVATAISVLGHPGILGKDEGSPRIAGAIAGAPDLSTAGEGAADHATQAAGSRRPATILLLVIVASGVIQASHSTLYAFGSIHWESLGWSGGAIGGLWALGVLAEIGLFILGGHLVRSIRAGIIMLGIGGASAAVRFTIMAFDPGEIVTIALQVLHAGSFAAAHLGMIALLGGLSPPGQRARMQGWATSVNALVMALATLASGPAYRAFGGLAYLGMVPLGLIGLGLSVAIWRMASAQHHPVNPR